MKKKRRKKEFGLQEFVRSVDRVMQKQVKENPSIKQVHARLSPEWQEVSNKIATLLTFKEEEKVEKLREEIIAHGEIATRVLIDLLLSVVHKELPSKN